MIQNIRKHEAFAGRGRAIRAVKVEDFYEIIRHIEKMGIRPKDSEKYFKDFTKIQLEVLRDRMLKVMHGKEQSEVSGIGGDAWKSPITMDLMDNTVLPGFEKSDRGDRGIIVTHILLAYKSEKISEQNKEALRWLLTTERGGRFFFTEELAKKLNVDLPKKPKKPIPDEDERPIA